LEFGGGEEEEVVQERLQGGLREAAFGAGEGEAAHPTLLHWFGKPVQEKGDEVGFDGEAAGGGLDEPGGGDAADFAGELLLGGAGAEVLDDGVAEDDVEGLIAKGKPAGVGLDLGKAGGLGVEVEQGHLWNGEAEFGGEVPEVGGAADVEDPGGGGDVQGAVELLEAGGAEAAEGGMDDPVGEAAGPLDGESGHGG
jgi:hypothetical protein